MLRGVDQLVEDRLAILVGFGERGLRGNLDVVVERAVVCPTTSIPDADPRGGDGLLGGFVVDDGRVVDRPAPTGPEVIEVTSLDLIDVEHGIRLHDEEPIRLILAGVALGHLRDRAPEDDLAAPLALGHTLGPSHDLASEALPLIERGPPPRREVMSCRRHLQQDRIDAPVGLPGDDVGGEPGVLVGPPRASPGRDVAGFQGDDDLVGDRLSKLLLACHVRSPLGPWLVNLTTRWAVFMAAVAATRRYRTRVETRSDRPVRSAGSPSSQRRLETGKLSPGSDGNY